MADPRQAILERAGQYSGFRYQLSPPPRLDQSTIDCSLFVLDVFKNVGLPFPVGVRTAEQIRQATVPIGWHEVKPGDLLFFEGTYDAAGPAGPDGHIASHVGISLGAGTMRMWDAHDRNGEDVAVTDIGPPYWQDKLFDARRHVALVEAKAPGLTDAPDHAFTFAGLWPAIKAAGEEFGYDPKKLAGMVKQESGFRNWRVHHDGTGHGLLGLDDNGLLPDFEGWSGFTIGRGQGAASIPIVPQLRYAAMALARYARQFGGDEWAATRAWHRGAGLMNDARGQNYEQLIRAHVGTLFAAGEPASPPAPPPPNDELARLRAENEAMRTMLGYASQDVSAALEKEAAAMEASLGALRAAIATLRRQTP